MTIFNTFTNYQRVKKLPELDILIWTASLINYKRLGYRTKLFCEPKDIKFLIEWHLFELYDEIDTQLFSNAEKLKEIDSKHFWSSRKIEALYYQLEILKEPSIYSDTDIIMWEAFDVSKDTLFWSPEEWNTDEGQIYVSWDNLSTPPNYHMPDYIKKTADAVNCGIMYFKNKKAFLEYRKQYYDFALDNPCEILRQKEDAVEDLVTNNSVWACNAEQRILKAVMVHSKQEINYVMPDRKKGIGDKGAHFFFYRIAWLFLHDDIWKPAPDAIPVLNMTIALCLKTVAEYSERYHEFWTKKEWLKDFEEKYDPKNSIWPVDSYI